MLSYRSWTADSTLRLLSQLLLALGGIGLLSIGLEHFTQALPEVEQERIVGVAGTLTFHAIALGLIYSFLRANGQTWADGFGFKRQGALRALGWSVVAIAGVMPVSIGLLVLSQQIMVRFQLPLKTETAVQIFQNSPLGWPLAVQAAMAVITAPLVEELLFRGLLYPMVKQTGHPRLALFGTALLFALVHANLMAFVPLTVLGIVLALLYEHTDNLLSSIAAHSLFNLTNLAWLIFQQYH